MLHNAHNDKKYLCSFGYRTSGPVNKNTVLSKRGDLFLKHLCQRLKILKLASRTNPLVQKQKYIHTTANHSIYNNSLPRVRVCLFVTPKVIHSQSDRTLQNPPHCFIKRGSPLHLELTRDDLSLLMFGFNHWFSFLAFSNVLF